MTTHNRDLALKAAILDLNRDQGYSNRYRLVMSADRKPGEPRALAVLKAVGTKDENITGWRHPDAILAYIAGYREGLATAKRRAERELER